MSIFQIGDTVKIINAVYTRNPQKPHSVKQQFIGDILQIIEIRPRGSYDVYKLSKHPFVFCDVELELITKSPKISIF